MGTGVGVRWAISILCEGRLATGGNTGWAAEVGAEEPVTMAESLSSVFSSSRALFGVCPTTLGFAGRRRATCSMHSTRAF
jgi:hypothetical protein